MSPQVLEDSVHPRLCSGARPRLLNFTVRRNARDPDAPVRLNPRNSRIVFLCVCIALGALFLRFESWPFWVQSLLIVASIVTFPLMNSLGVLRQLGLENTPGLGGVNYFCRSRLSFLPVFGPHHRSTIGQSDAEGVRSSCSIRACGSRAFWGRGVALGEGGTLLSGFRSDAGSGELEHDGVMHDAIDGRRGGHRILEDLVPFREHQV